MNFVASMEDAIPFMSLDGQHKTDFPSLSHVHPSPHPPDMRLKPHKDEQPPVEARPTASTHCGAPHNHLGPCWAPEMEARAPSKDMSLPGAMSIHKYHICQRAGARCLPQIGCPGG